MSTQVQVRLKVVVQTGLKAKEFTNFERASVRAGFHIIVSCMQCIGDPSQKSVSI